TSRTCRPTSWPSARLPWANPPRSPSGTRGIGGQPHELLAEVPTLEEADEGGRSVLEPVRDVLAVLDPALAHPAPAVRDEVGLAVEVVRDDEALQQHPVDQERAQVGAGHRPRRVVLRAQPAEGNARVHVDVPEHRVEDRAADVLEVDVDAVR